MGLFDGRIERHHDRPGHRIDRPRRRPARRAGDPGRRRPRTEPQHGRAAARLLDVRRIHPHRRGHPQPGRLAPPRGRAEARPASMPACRCSARLPRVDELSVPSRHLGLVTAVEHGAAPGPPVDAMTALVAEHVDLAGVVAAAGGHVVAEPWSAETAVGEPHGRPRHRCARGGQGVQLLLRRAPRAAPRGGRRRRRIRPADRAVAAEHRGTGAARRIPRRVLHRTVRQRQSPASDRGIGGSSGAPVHAECAGLTYLVDDLDGHPMCGVLAGTARFTDRLTLGYRDAVAAADSSLYEAGERAVGHEFHRTTVTFADGYQPAWVLPRPRRRSGPRRRRTRRCARELSPHPPRGAAACGNSLRRRRRSL